MKKVLFLLFLIPVFSFSQTKQTLTLTSDIWPPFTNVEDQRAIALDIVETALSRSDILVNYQIQEFTEVIQGINEGTYDGSAALWINKERKETLLFSKPYLQNQLILVGRKGKDVSIAELSRLEGAKIGVIKDYAYGEPLQYKGIEWVYNKGDQQNLDKLLAGQLDYILVEALLIQYLLKTQFSDVGAYLELGQKPLVTKTLHFAIRKDISNAASIIETFNTAIQEMVSDGTYNDILDLSWIRADVDGDGIPELVLDGEVAGPDEPVNTYNVFYSPAGTSTNRYYINGKFYDNWESVPQEAKLKIPKVAPQYEGKGELKLRLK